MGALKDGLGGGSGLSGIEDEFSSDKLVTGTNRVYFRDAGLNVYSSADGQLDITADTTVAVSGAVTMDSTLNVTGVSTLTGKVNFGLNGGAASASGILAGVGTSANPATTAAADKMFIELRTESTATSGDSRCLYMRHALNGAGISGEALRAFAKVTAAAATCRGAHISIDLSTTGTCSGFGAGVDAQVLLGDTSYASTLTALNAEIYSAGTSSDVSGKCSFLRCVLGGDSTGLANVEDEVYALSFIGGSIASGNLVEADADETKFSHKFRINVYGTDMWVMCANS